MRGWRMWAVPFVLLSTATASYGAGFRLPEAGVKAMGMGFAFTAQADDPSAIYFNPAGITQLPGNNIMLGVTYVRENGQEFSGSTPLTGATPVSPGVATSEAQKDLNFFIPNGYYTYGSKDRGIAFGVGVFAPFGLGQEYKDQNTSIFRNQTTKIELQTIVVNPTFAFDINEYVSVGVGIDWMWGSVEKRSTPVIPASLGGPGQFYTQLKGEGDAWGYNFGILVKPVKDLKIGFSYRSQFNLDFNDADFDANTPSGGVPPFFPMGSTQAYGTLNLPATAALGISYTWHRLTVEVDADWTFWSSYKELKITNKTVPVYSSTSPKNWEDVCAFRIGAEYRVTDPLALRAGFYYDPTPAPAETLGPELPDATRLNYTLGAGYKIGNWTIDGAFLYIDKDDRSVSNVRVEGASLVGQNGTWKGSAWLAGLDIGYRF